MCKRVETWDWIGMGKKWRYGMEWERSGDMGWDGKNCGDMVLGWDGERGWSYETEMRKRVEM